MYNIKTGQICYIFGILVYSDTIIAHVSCHLIFVMCFVYGGSAYNAQIEIQSNRVFM